ncbi:spore germination protein [Paenibacillus sp. N4]|uniref:spore germination protein n=1 Tax=Paenibacillus vietnamensis TaxID=2590547 RepID=UPI001CD10FDD|nr:spore germination protein [Paenibacillus vietnamensis]MCA0758028.1 spore germination protein [Paenibacillus vietnamensis]
MINEKDQITTIQVAVIVVNAMLGSGILTLPRSSATLVQTPDVWISVLLGGLLAMIAGVVMAVLAKRYPGQTVFQFNGRILGKWIGALVSLMFVVYFFMTAAYQVRIVTEVTSLFLLEGTPNWAIIMVFMWVSLYLMTGGINPIARLFEMILPVTILIYLLVMLMALNIVEVNNLRPVLGDGIAPVWKGIKSTALSFLGVETILILTAFMKRSEQAVKAVVYGVAVPMALYLITVVVVIGALSVDGVVTRTWPTLDLIRSFEYTGLIFERFESLFLVIWIMQIYSTYTISFYAAALGLAQLFNRPVAQCLYGLLPIVFIISVTPKDLTACFAFGDLLGQSSAFIFGLIPFFLLLITRVRKGKSG